MPTTVDLRCDANPRRLFAKLKQEGEKPVMAEGNLLEFACRDCKKALRENGDNASQVLHRFNFAGELVETEVVP